jgi:hypothetical protein
MSATPPPPPALPAPLARLALKRGVGLGGLTADERAWALAVAARCLPAGDGPDEGDDEAGVNGRLRDALAGDAAFLDTDHVELRRWLVDTGWWRRDGFGRRYHRTPAGALPATLAAIDAAVEACLADGGPATLGPRLAAHRDADTARRAARAAAWQARSTGG